MKFIHCSDIHLDSPMESNLTPRQARERNAELCATFARMVDYAKAEGITAVLIAGDLFDTQRISATTARFLLDTIASAPQVSFLYLKGNHDESHRAFGGMALPVNLLGFTDSPTSYTFGDVTVTAAELTDRSCITLYDALQLQEEHINILMLHGQTAPQIGEELVCLPRLKGKHIDYLALGHLHSYQQGQLDSRGIWCYCGCLEGRGYDECGEKGFVLVEAENNCLTHRFIPFAKRTLHHVSVDITGLQDTPAMLTAMTAAAAHIPESDLVKFTLTGTYTPDTHKDLPFLQNMLSSRFYALKLKDESRLHIYAAAYENDISLKGEFLRLVMASDLPDADRDRIICAGLEALRGEEISL